MKLSHLKKSGHALIFAAMFLGALLFIGCSGDDGATGPQGIQGPTGPTGPPGEVSTGAETCNLCHTGAILSADVALVHPDRTAEDVTITIGDMTIADGVLTVAFSAETDSGPVTGLTVNEVKFMIADMVPAGTTTIGYPDGESQGTWDNPYFERWAYEAGLGYEHPGDTVPPEALSEVSDGNYTYTFTTGFADATTGAPDYNESHNQRLFIDILGLNDADTGTPLTNQAVALQDFTTSGGVVTKNPDNLRQYVTTDACKKCHGARFERAAHAETYPDTRACVICHSPIGVYGAFMQPDYAYFGPLIHQIHNAVDNPNFQDRPIIDGATAMDGSWELVAFPRKFLKQKDDPEDRAVPTCTSCHSNPNNLDLGAGDETGTYLTHPTAQICNGCHIKYGVNFETGVGHDGGPQPDNTLCRGCHPAQGVVTIGGFDIPGVEVAHNTTPSATVFPENVPEFKTVDCTITPAPANGLYYVAGDEPEVRCTLTDQAGDPISPSRYTIPSSDPSSAAGVTGGGFSEAYVQIYGPRARALPVLATDSTTDPNWDGESSSIEDEHDMRLGGENPDPQVTTDATGFGYKFLKIPASTTLPNGTYMVRAAFADYGRVGSGDYHIDSTFFTTIQIGTDVVEPKIAGNLPDDVEGGVSVCYACHGDRTAPFHDERHSVVFDTDQCLACHHDTGHDTGEPAHGIPLANRVHAVHFANPEGDIRVFSEGSDPSSRPWDHVSFPRDIDPPDNSGCRTCHTPDTSSGTFLTNPYMMPCVGCHSDASTITHMNQQGGPFLPAQ